MAQIAPRTNAHQRARLTRSRQAFITRFPHIPVDRVSLRPRFKHTAKTLHGKLLHLLSCCVCCNTWDKKNLRGCWLPDREPTPVNIRMSYFGVALQRQAERHHLSQSDVARQCGLSRSFISRVISGESRDLSDQNVAAILKVFAADLHTQAELIAARCMDAREVARAAGTPAADLVEISIKHGVKPEKNEVELPQVHLSSETEKAFAWLRSQCPINPDLQQHLVGYARLTGMK